MPLKNKTKFLKTTRTPRVLSRGIENLLHLIEEWKTRFMKGEKGELETRNYLISQGYQVSKVFSWNFEKSETTFKDKHKEDIIFSPDFLVTNGKEIFFAEVKGKTSLSSLGLFNKAPYDKYWNIMQKLQGIGFKTYFPIEDTKKIYILENLIDPKDLPPARYIGGYLCYPIPNKHLKKLGEYAPPQD